MVKRLDALVAERAGFPRVYAAEVIAAGRVLAGGRAVTKPGAKFDDSIDIVVNAEPPRFVGRGGEKLDGVLDVFGVEARGKRCLDIGASTGGFTDCLLQRGAGGVTAVDVGHGQFAGRLLADERVTLIEGVNIRDVAAGQFGLFDLAVCDVSFISLTKILANIRGQLKGGGDAVLLVKPQFECGRAALNKRGVVVKERDREAAFQAVTLAAAGCGFRVMGDAPSPVEGGDGNKERFIWLSA